jgi:hypothetical protein
MAEDQEKKPVLIIPGGQGSHREAAAASGCVTYLWTLKICLGLTLLSVLTVAIGLPILIVYKFDSVYLWFDGLLASVFLVAAILVFFSHALNRRHPCYCSSYLRL